MPPMAGLQLIWPSVSMLWVSSSVRAPSRARRGQRASVPAWPPPMTITSSHRDTVPQQHPLPALGKQRIERVGDGREAGVDVPFGKKVGALLREIHGRFDVDTQLESRASSIAMHGTLEKVPLQRPHGAAGRVRPTRWR
jgi:hypothetical protein